jgi:hypothetical protein
MYSQVYSQISARDYLDYVPKYENHAIPIVNAWCEPKRPNVAKDAIVAPWLDSEVMRSDVVMGAKVPRNVTQSERYKSAMKVFEHLFNTADDSKIYGGFPRDYVTKIREFNDIDVWIPTSENVRAFIARLSCDFWIIPQRQLRVYQTSSPCIQMNYKIHDRRNHNEILIDVVTDCDFSCVGVDFTANALYLTKNHAYGGITLQVKANPQVEYSLEEIIEHLNNRKIVKSMLGSFKDSEHYDERVTKLTKLGFTM